MSFLKITDPSKRAAMVDEYLKLKKSIQQSSLSEKLGDSDLQRDLIKLYKPITESQAGITKELSDASTALKALPESISSSLQAIMPAEHQIPEFSQYPSTEALDMYGPLASKYLRQYLSNKTAVDTTFGIYSKNDREYIGDLPITIQDNDITVGEKTYTGTPGLWELMTLNDPDESIYTDDDLKNYKDILLETNAMPDEERPAYPKNNRSKKWEKIVRTIWFATKEVRKDIAEREASLKAERKAVLKAGKASGTTHKTKDKTTTAFGSTLKTPEKTGKAYITPRTTGKGVTVYLPSDTNTLVKMLKLRMDAYDAGNTGVADEAIAICDALLNQGVLNKETYKVYITRLNRL